MRASESLVLRKQHIISALRQITSHASIRGDAALLLLVASGCPQTRVADDAAEALRALEDRIAHGGGSRSSTTHADILSDAAAARSQGNEVTQAVIADLLSLASGPAGLCGSRLFGTFSDP